MVLTPGCTGGYSNRATFVAHYGISLATMMADDDGPPATYEMFMKAKKGMAFVEEGIKKYEEKLLIQKQRSLNRLAKEHKVQIIYNV